ncbi:hypothetical protein BD410DRAFT_652028 [Rickenella mellea]|uniref:Uncharacterized protein n=1 Tax=Rickenella mellea TaxID=50990 RepID=A0A4Y7PN77_9AGAM|nr:hypothetical protein BD410DRAFT_652028 [Rickenella mellea]
MQIKLIAIIVGFAVFPSTTGTAVDILERGQLICPMPSSCKCKLKPPESETFCGNGILGCLQGHEYICVDDGITACDLGVTENCYPCTSIICPLKRK